MQQGNTPIFDQLTVIIPVYNRAGIVRRTLDSLASQSVLPGRLIVVDNGSDDDSAEVVSQWLASHPEVNGCMMSCLKPGASAARNAGLAEVATEWTMYFDSDDEMLPGHIERLQSAVMGYPDIDLFGWDVGRLCPDGSKKIEPFEPRDIAYHNLMHGTLATQRYAARTRLFVNAGGWNESLSTWDDIELGARMIAIRPRIRRLDGEPTVLILPQTESITGTSYGSRLSRYQTTLNQLKAGSYSGLKAHVGLKAMILAADIAKEGGVDVSELRQWALDCCEGRYERLLLRCAYAYTRSGARGCARILGPLLRSPNH